MGDRKPGVQCGGSGTCPPCEGKGFKDFRECVYCDGSGRSPVQGEEDGARLAVRGESRSVSTIYRPRGIDRIDRPYYTGFMAMGTRETDHPPLWTATSDLPRSPGHPFYARLSAILDDAGFEAFCLLYTSDAADDLLCVE